MKKFLLVFLLLFSFATLSALGMDYQAANNYCNNFGRRLPTAAELTRLCGNRDYYGIYWILEGHAFSTISCKTQGTSKSSLHTVMCVNR